MTNERREEPDAAAAASLRAVDASERLRALAALAAAGRSIDATLVEAVVACLGTDAKAVQRRAAEVLTLTTGSARAAALVALRRELATLDSQRGWGATFALGKLGVQEPLMLPCLVEALGDRDGDRRWAAAEIVAAYGGRDPGAIVPAMVALARTGSAPARKMALYVLRDLAPGTAEVAAALAAGLRDADSGVRLAALSGLCRLDPLPADACERVLGLLETSDDAGLRRAAVSALGTVGRGVAAVDAVLDVAATSDDPGLRRAALAARRRLAAG